MGGFHNFSIKFKVLLIALVGGVGFAAYFYLNFVTTQNNIERLNKVTSVYYPIVQHLDFAKLGMEKIKESHRQAVQLKDPAMLESAKEMSKELRIRFVDIGTRDASLAGESTKLLELLASYNGLAVQTTLAKIAGKSDEEVNKVWVIRDTSLEAIEEALAELRESSQAKLVGSIVDANKDFKSTLQFGGIIGLVIAVLVGFLSFVIVSFISQDIKGIREKLREMSSGQGDLTTRLKSRGKDELGDLVDEFNDFIDMLDTIIGNTIGHIYEMKHSSQRIASDNSELAARSEEQAHKVDNILASMKSIAATVQQNATNSMIANDLAEAARKRGEQGRAEVDEAINAMQAINESTKKIFEITGVIDGIAFQTNLLALNAAIEAARSGEHGRGFAVVAKEVRNLAQKAADSAKEIKDLIDSSVDRIDKGTELVRRSSETLLEVLNGISEVSEIMTNIARDNQAQNSSIDQVNESLGYIDDSARKNSLQVDSTSEISRDMQEQASAVANLVTFFKVTGQERLMQVEDSERDQTSNDSHENKATSSAAES